MPRTPRRSTRRVDEQFSIGTVGQSADAQHCRTPCSSHPATFFYKA